MKKKGTGRILKLALALVFLTVQIAAMPLVEASAAKSTSIHLHGSFTGTETVYVGMSYGGSPITSVAGQTSAEGLFVMTHQGGSFTIKDDGLEHLPLLMAFIVNGDVYIVNPPGSRDPRIIVGQEGNLGAGTNNYWIDNSAASVSISLQKSADPGPYSPGDTVDYTFEVVNTGGIGLYNVGITDTDIGYTTDSADRVALAPGGSHTFYASYVIPSDYASNKFENTATAYGTYGVPGLFETTISDMDSAEVAVVIPADEPSLSISKIADKDEGETGDTVNYTIVVTNSGNVALEGVMITDPKLGIEEGPYDIGIGGSKTVYGSYILKDEDLAAGHFVNTATASVYYEQELIEVDDSETVQVLPTLDMEISKNVDRHIISAGESVIYTIRVRNTSNVTLENILVTDAALSYTYTIASLASGAEWSVSLPAVTYGEWGTYTNTAVAEYGIETDYYMSRSDSAEVIVNRRGSISISKLVQDMPEDYTSFTVDITGPNGYTSQVTISQMQPGGTAFLLDLELGTYTLTETAESRYYTVGGSTRTVTLTEQTPNADVQFVNAVQPVIQYGTVTVIKDVANIDNDPTEFEIVLNGVFKLNVREGTSASLTIPLGTYAVTETPVEGYNNVSITPVTFTLSASGQTVTVVNEKVIPTGSIKVEKLFEDGIEDDTGFTVSITGPDGYEDSLTIAQGAPVTLTGLKLGSYTLTEASAEGYLHISDKSVTVVLDEADPDAAVSFINGIEEIIVPPVEPPADEPELPQTGGAHPSIFHGAGSLIALVGIFLLFVRRKKEELAIF